MPDPESIDKLAEAIADGAEVNWASVESSASTERERAVIARLKLIEALAEQRRNPAGTPRPDTPTQVRPPGEADHSRRWGHLSILEKVGQGAFGEVYRAHDPKLARDVALKLLRESGSTVGASTAVIEEGRLLARVRHPNVATVYGADRTDGYVGIWMEFIDGLTLDQVLQEHGGFDATEAAGIGIDICRALGAVHHAGLVHGDVKAQNVMRENADGRLVLMDFGTGRERERPEEPVERLTGTPLYLAPEVLEGAPATVRSDIYSLGVLLFHLVTESYPVTARTLREVIEAHRAGRRTSVQESRPDLSPAFANIVERATAADPVRRFATAAELEAALSEAIAADKPRLHRGASWTLSRTLMTAAAVILSLGLVAGTWWRSQRAVLTPAQHMPASAVVAQAQGAVAPSLVTPPQLIQAPQVATPAQRRLALVATFDTLVSAGHDDQRWLGDAVSRWIERELTNSRVVAVVSRERAENVLRHLGRPPETIVDAIVARQICARDAGIPLFVSGTVALAGGVYHLTASILDSADGRIVTTAHETAPSVSELTRAAQAVASRLRESLDESSTDIARTLADAKNVKAPSLQAFHLYSQSYRDRDTRGWEESLRLIDESLRLEPDFPAARIWRAWVLHALERPRSEWESDASRAMALRATALPWERYWIEGSNAHFANEMNQAGIAYMKVLDLNPTHDWTAIKIGVIAGRLSLREGAPYFFKAADARPYDRRAAFDALENSIDTTNVAQATSHAARLRTIVKDDGWSDDAQHAWITDSWRAWIEGNMPEASRRLGQTVESITQWKDPERSVVAIDVAQMYMALGRTRDAERAARLVSPGQNRSYLLSLAAYWRRDDVALGEYLPVQLKLDQPDYVQPQNAELWTIMLLQAGRSDEAAAVVEARRSNAHYPLVLHARLLASQKHFKEALDVVESTPLQAEPSPFYLGDRQQVLAEMLTEQGHPERAVNALETVRWRQTDDNHSYISAPIGIRNLATLAELDRGLRRNSATHAIEEELRRLLAAAETDFPLLKSVK